MTLRGIWLATMAVLLVVNPAAGGQAPAMHSSEMTALMGTWVFDMTDPPDLVGTKETVRILEKNGVVAATVQVGKYPPNDVTGILKDGDLLVLTTTLRENGQPIWVVISLKQAGETMTLAQMMERSQTIKRGTGKKQVN
jgi:hypothetical protein